MDPIPLPQLSSRYEIQELIGEGGMGRIFRAWDRTLARGVAIKTVRTTEGTERRRVEGEVRLLARLRHEGVARLLDSGVHGEELYLVLELCEGMPLDRMLRERPPDAERIRWLVGVAVKIAEALDHIHACGIVHRDLKPANVMIVAPGQPASAALLFESRDPAVKLIDFGLAVDSASPRQEIQAAAGTPIYMSPEQIRGAAEPRSDLYSLGVILYHLITGTPPFASLPAILSRTSPPRAPAQSNPNCPLEVSNLVLELLAAEPHLRPANARETRLKLLALLDATHQTLVEEPRILPAVFTGRQTELTQLRRKLALAATGKGSVMIITGARNAGKSWLVRESGLASEALADHGMRCVRTTFVRGSFPLEALQQALLQVAEALPEESASPSRPAAAGTSDSNDAPREWNLAATADSASPAADDASARALRDRRIDAAVRLLRRGASRPLFLVFESLEHAGEGEIEVLSRFARGLKDLPALLCLTHRPGGQSSERLKLWLTELETEPWAQRLDIDGLADSEVADLMRRCLYPPAPVSLGLVKWVLSRSSGLPGEVMRELKTQWRSGKIRLIDGEWCHESAGKPDLEASAAALASLATELSEPELRLLYAALALNAPASAALLDRLATGTEERSRAAGRETLPRLIATGLLSEDAEGVTVTPELVDDATTLARISSLLGKDVTSQIHGRLADALIGAAVPGVGEASLRIARHLEQADRPQEAAPWFAAAARRLAAAASNTLAMEAYRTALKLGGPAAAIDQEIAELAAQSGDYATALDHLHAAVSVAGRSHQLLDRIGRVYHRQGDLTQALAVFAQCLDLAGESAGPRALSLLRLGGLHLEQGNADRATPLLQESLSLYTALGDPGERARAQFSLGVAAKMQNRLDEAVQHMLAALENAQCAGSLVHVASTLNNLGNLFRLQGNDHDALDCLRRSLETRQRLGDRQGVAIVLNNISRVHLFRGELKLSQLATAEALGTFEEIGDKKGVLIARCNLGETLEQLGELDKARTLLVDAIAVADRLKAQRIVDAAHITLGALELDAGDARLAADHLHRAIRSLPAEKPNELRAQALVLLCSAAMQLQDSELAEDCLREAEELVEELKLRGKLGSFHCLQMRFHLQRGEAETALELGKPYLQQQGGLEKLSWALLRIEAGRAYRELGPDWADQTEKELEAAIRMLDAMPSPHNAALARLELAQYWILLEEPARAAELQGRAEIDLRACGAHKRTENPTWSER